MSTGFISENDIVEARKKRQEEWEKVRTADQPLERPEEPYDSRPLYDRLKEQKMKKDLEYEEAHKLKNLIRGLDDDEVEFLDLVDRTKMNVERQHLLEERKELNEFRQRVVNLQEKTMDEKIQSEKTAVKPKTTLANSRPSQKSIMSGLVVRKRKNGEAEEPLPPQKKPTGAEDNSKQTAAEDNCKETPNAGDNISKEGDSLKLGALKCIGVLPGIGRYRESSDSEMSSDSEEELDQIGRYDLVGRNKCKNGKGKNEAAE